MKLHIAQFINDPKQLLLWLARENVVPVKAPEWADYPFELRRNEKVKRGQIGQHLIGKETAQLIMERLGIHDEQSCKEVREKIKHLRSPRC